MSKKDLIKKEEPISYNELLTLTPRILDGEEKERIEPYLSRLKQAIDQGDILNIALTGNYGSGKSTILRTFENENKEYKYLSISLASFNDDQEKPDLKENEEIEKHNLENKKKSELQEDIEQQLEISILQQIFYKVSADEIPDSRFKRIKDFDNKRTRKYIAFSALWIISAFFLFGFDYIQDLNPRVWDFGKAESWIAIISASFFVYGLSYLMKFGFRSFSNSKINKFSFKGEIELGEASIFNKNLDEILYFFERTEYNVVVFEDIDRFDTTGIFTKLRELNKLINNCDLIDRDINFIYAVKDTVFKDKTERVKFFDFIIPVIPFINSKNASDQLNKLIKKYELTDKLSKKFVSDIVSMIPDIDMRLLINTFHEYTVFKEKIGDDGINHERLFSILVYKNLYPEDFSMLYQEGGKLFNVINSKEKYIITLTKKLKNDIQELESEIDSLDQHNHIQIKELRSAYILRYIDSLKGIFLNISIAGKNKKLFELIEDENFKEIQEGKKVEYEFLSSGYKRKEKSNVSFDHIEGLVNNKYPYDERERFIRDRKENKVNSIKNEILEKKNQIREANKLTLSEVFKKMDTNDVYRDFKDNDLVRYLLSGGYLNENYLDYISLFHEVNLTRDEFKYLRSIKSNKEPDFEFEIENHFALVSDIDKRYFSNKSILNYDLVEYLVNHSSQFQDKATMFYSSLANREEIYFEFIVTFIKERSSCRRKFVLNLIKQRKSFWDELFHDSNLPEQEIFEVVNYLLEYSSADDLKQLDNVESLKGYFEEIENPISVGTSLVDSKTFQEFINAKSVKLKNLEKTDNLSNHFFDFIIKNKAYEINYYNVLVILNSILSDIEESEIKQSIYTHICDSDITELKNYIEEYINEFVSKVLLYDKRSHSENEDSLIALLNAESLDSRFKSQLIDIQKNRISSIDKLIDHEAREIVTSANKIKATWENVYFYYDQFDESFLNETIIKFLNNEDNHTDLSESSLFEISEVERAKLLKFRDALLYCSELNPVAYKNILKSQIPIDSVDFSKLNTEMAEILLEEEILGLDTHNYDGLKSIEGSLHIGLIEAHIKNFIKDSSSFSLDNKDWHLILSSDKIKKAQKAELLPYLSTNELSDKNVAKIVLELHPGQKIEKYGFDEIKAMLAHRGALRRRISLLLFYIDDLRDDQLKVILSQFGEDYKNLFELRKMPSFPNNKEHKLLLENLIHRDIISRIIPKGEKIKAICQWKK